MGASAFMVSRGLRSRRLRRGAGGLRGVVRSSEEIDGIRRAGGAVAEALEAARSACVVGSTTSRIDDAIRGAIEALGARPALAGFEGDPRLGRRPFPAASCISVGDELLHAVPGRRLVRDGDLVSIDVAVEFDGWFADGAATIPVGSVDARARAMIACAERMLEHAICSMRPGRRWSSIAAQLEEIAVGAGFAIATRHVGHGIGRALHESPQVPCALDAVARAGADSRDFCLRPGLVLAIEPTLVLEPPRHDAAGVLVAPETEVAEDGWTVRVRSGAPSCHVEHTVAVGAHGAEVLTALRRAA